MRDLFIVKQNHIMSFESDWLMQEQYALMTFEPTAMTERAIGRGRETERDRDRERQTDRQTSRQTDRQAGRQTVRQRDRQTDGQTEREGERQRDRERQRHTETEAEQKQKQTDRLTHKQTDTEREDAGIYQGSTQENLKAHKVSVNPPFSAVQQPHIVSSYRVHYEEIHYTHINEKLKKLNTTETSKRYRVGQFLRGNARGREL